MWLCVFGVAARSVTHDLVNSSRSFHTDWADRWDSDGPAEPMLMILVGAIIGYAIFLVAGTVLTPKLALRRHRNRLRSLPIADLALEAIRSADAAGIRKHFPQASIFNDQRWTAKSLAKALDDLYASMATEDRRTAEVGPGSWVYFWYDFGLASIREILDDQAELV
jgi:hypothetical protein